MATRHPTLTHERLQAAGINPSGCRGLRIASETKVTYGLRRGSRGGHGIRKLRRQLRRYLAPAEPEWRPYSVDIEAWADVTVTGVDYGFSPSTQVLVVTNALPSLNVERLQWLISEADLSFHVPLVDEYKSKLQREYEEAEQKRLRYGLTSMQLALPPDALTGDK